MKGRLLVTRKRSFVRTAALPTGQALECEAVGNTVQEARQRSMLADRAGLASEDKKSGLEYIVGVMRITQHSTAHPKHQRAVSSYQFGKRLVLAPLHEDFKQVRVVESGPLPGRQQPGEFRQCGSDRVGHGIASSPG